METLRVNNIKKKYQDREILKGISLHVKRGEVVGLLGPNGAGKTTCFYIIVGLISSENGSILLDKADITNLPIHIRAKKGISYLPQEASIFKGLSVQDNISAVLELNPKLTKPEKQQKLETLLEELHITHVRNTLGISLSGGERRRCEIARALAIEPQFILLDEPFAGIDPISVIDVKQIITHLCKKNIGVLITDHNVRDTLTICQRAYIVNQGEVIHHGTPTDVLADKRVREVYLGEDFDL